MKKNMRQCLRVYDPVAAENARTHLSEWSALIEYVGENYEALDGADALLLLTEWPLFRRPDFPRMKELLKTPLIFDGRNQYAPPAMKSMGFEYVCIGRG